MSKFKYIFTIFLFIFMSCKKNNDFIQKKIEKQKIKEDTLTPPPNKETIFERNDNETAINFINRTYGNLINLNHPIIETDYWIKDANVIFVFINKKLEDDLGTDVKGYIYVSKNKKTYHQLIIDSYGPEGRNAKVETIFFANADDDSNKELIVLCSWKQQLKEIAEGKLYQTYIYDNFDFNNKSKKLIYLEGISNHFGSEFEGINEGVQHKAKYKTAKDIKEELNNFNL